MTENKQKIRVGLIFGGRSGEHEVSLASARSVQAHLDPEKYEVVPIGITKTGAWLLGTGPVQLQSLEHPLTNEATENATNQTAVATLVEDPTGRGMIPDLGNQGTLDVILPVLHGTYGEDGSLQGLLDMANVPYVGCGVLGAALGMDKEKMKRIFQSVGLPIVDYLAFRRSEWERSPETILAAIDQKLGYPNFVKPANLGSSVGINKAHNQQELIHAIEVATEFDRKIVIEHGLICREFECAALGNDEPLVSVVGEIVASNEFYDYNAKYLSGKSQTIIPANISQAQSDEIRRQALQAFQALDLNGLARIDFFMDKVTEQVYINEVNTMPGFTEASMYPKLWEASGLPYTQLLDRLIELAIERFADRQRNRTNR